ncbi:hypothetical protein BLGI_1470 [Brevibacillus laterosporus GI-9]|nr:hypothetical protein BLGI_1470 [Brevibacillus laterosporus GI-9]
MLGNHPKGKGFDIICFDPLKGSWGVTVRAFRNQNMSF